MKIENLTKQKLAESYIKTKIAPSKQELLRLGLSYARFVVISQALIDKLDELYYRPEVQDRRNTELFRNNKCIVSLTELIAKIQKPLWAYSEQDETFHDKNIHLVKGIILAINEANKEIQYVSAIDKLVTEVFALIEATMEEYNVFKDSRRHISTSFDSQMFSNLIVTVKRYFTANTENIKTVVEHIKIFYSELEFELKENIRNGTE